MTEEFGRYQLLHKLGAGGVAEVYIAQTGDSSEERFSVKKLHREHLHSPDVIAAFIAEAELTLKLVHPNLVRVIDFGRIDGEYFIAAEYVEGVDLARLREPGTLTDSASLQIAIDVCAAMDHVHTRGKIVHGDLSPANILVGTDGLARVTDFGVAVGFGDTGQPVRGTYAYMSPEQARGAALDARSDVFAVGVLIWELLQRKRLFRRKEHFLTLTAVVEDEAPGLDIAELDQIVQRALMKDAGGRYATCGELAEALTEAWRALGVEPVRTEVGALVAAVLDSD